MTERHFASIEDLNDAMRHEFPSGEGIGRLVPGEGPVLAAIAFVGEQPGDAEDASHEMLHAEEIAEAIRFVLTRSERADVVNLRIEPRLQKTS